ncbi:MAG: ATP-binding cassette domain-containing protein, partial [Mesorhizobium sp.]
MAPDATEQFQAKRDTAFRPELRDALVRLQKVSKVFPGGVVGLDAVDLDIAPGEFLTLLGPSGCGKTTSLRVIAGFESPTSGNVLLEGRDITGLR